MSVGDPVKDDTEVIQVLAPWDAVLRWKGVEFTVPLFARDKLVIKADEKPAETPTPSSGDAKPEPQTTAASAANAPLVGPPAPDDTKDEEPKLADSKPPEPKSDSAPDSTPAATPPSDPSPEPDTSDMSTPPQGGKGGRTE